MFNTIQDNLLNTIEAQPFDDKNFKKHPLAHDIAITFKKHGFNFFASVPCSSLSPLLSELKKSSSKKNFFYLPREDICLATASGAYLSGFKPLVLMQNSGFAQSINAIASLIIPFEIPITMVISNRGGEDDSEENKVMGRITKSIIDLLKIPCKEISEKNYNDLAGWITTQSKKKNSMAILLEPTIFGWHPKS